MSKKKRPPIGKRGTPLPLGATVQPDGINFAIFSRHAKQVELVVETFGEQGESERYSFQLLPGYNRTGDVWHILLPLYWKWIRYGYRLDGESNPEDRGTFFDPAAVLIDPYSRMLSPRQWGEPAPYGDAPCCRIGGHGFDWQGDTPLKIPLAQTVIYELHVRGFTRSPTAAVPHPGTYRGVMAKIPYLKALGITAVELMPVAEFDENDNPFSNPETGKKLKNFWGYNSVNFFALKSAYAADPANHITEFKEMVLALHQAGIEVILDIVFNHSGEGNYEGKTSSFRGLDNPIYYLLDPESREYMNFSGCGNTMNCNHPVVRELIRSVLRYWVVEMHVDGFRFDLASILGRDTSGNVLPDPPMLEVIAEDPILRDTKIIAEAWDAAGLYQVGTFSTDARWSEWNGRYRDDLRSFFAGFAGNARSLATRIAGSSDLYQPSSRGPSNSINFITSHDGFTLYDLVSHEHKHNHANGENNQDGENHNISWNSGREGAPASAAIERLRRRRIKSMALTLLLSQGVPMLTAGDEFCRTQGGNNNAWCQDNETGWLDWSLAESNRGMLRFFRRCIELRRRHRVFQRETFFAHNGMDTAADIVWQSTTPGSTDWSDDCHHLAFLLNGAAALDNHFFVMLNGNREQSVTFTLPEPPQTKRYWHRIIDTARESPQDFLDLDKAARHQAGARVKVAPMAAVVLQTR